MALLLGGCPKRQTTSRLVYLPSPAPTATAPSAPSTETLVIEEPPPPAQAQEAPAPAPPPSRPSHRPRRVTPNQPADTPEVGPEPEGPPPTVEVPALEPRESREQESQQRSQVLRVQNDVEAQITRLEGAKLAPADHKTLEDARTFLGQSQKALEEGDLQRSLNLARKAFLLVVALGKGR